MNVHTLLSDAAAEVDTTVADETVQADLLRGRRALSRRRAQRTGVAGLVVAGAGVGALVLGGATPTPVSPEAGGSSGTVLAPGAIELVDFTGDQLAGYSVDEVPESWTLLHSDEHALTIGPQAMVDTAPDSYLGKLTVMLLSSDATLPTEGTTVPVGAGEGVYVESADQVDVDRQAAGGAGVTPFTGSLFYVDQASGLPVVVQVPTELDWTAVEAAEFAAGVHVTAAAEQSVG